MSNLTHEMRRTLDVLAMPSSGAFLSPYGHASIAAALADLDSLADDNRRLRAALEPVAYHLQTLRGKYAGAKRSDLTYIFSPGHADAVLAALAPAAAGGERT